MKKILTLFKREFEGHKIVGITDEITPGCKEAFINGIATVKVDGSCCAIIDGVFYKRYDAKKGKPVPDGAIPCCDPDPITGHWPHWVKVSENSSADKWFIAAFNNTFNTYDDVFIPKNGTYEAVGPHFNGNPYELEYDTLDPHGLLEIDVCRDFESIKKYLETNLIEGIVFWLNGEPACKIKRTDFGLTWPVRN